MKMKTTYFGSVGGNDGATRHLTSDQLARRWSMSEGALRNLRWAGRGPRFLKVGAGGRVLYRLEDIEAFERDNLSPSA